MPARAMGVSMEDHKDRKDNEALENKDLQDEKQSSSTVDGLADDSQKPSVGSGHSLPPRWDEEESRNITFEVADSRPLRTIPNDSEVSEIEVPVSDSRPKTPLVPVGDEKQAEEPSEDGDELGLEAAEPGDSDNEAGPELGDVSPADFVERPTNEAAKVVSKPVLVGIAVLLAIIGLTVYAFRERSDTASDSSSSVIGESLKQSDRIEGEMQAGEDETASGLPGKAPDAVNFSPTPETEAAANRPLPPKAPEKKAPTDSAKAKANDLKAKAKTDEAKVEAGIKAAENKAAAGAKAVETKAAETKTAVENKASEAKAAVEAKAAEAKTAAETKAAGAKTSIEGKASEAKAAVETKAAEAKTDVEGKASEAKTAVETKAAEAERAVETKAAEAKTAVDSKAAELESAVRTEEAAAKAAVETEAGKAEAKASEALAEAKIDQAGAAAQTAATEAKEPVISDFWVVNISSTPDAAESLRLLNRVNTEDVGGQVYFYETTVDGRTQHRIRIGFFDSKEKADEIGQKIKEKFSLAATPWAVRPTRDEVDLYRRK